MDVSFSFKHYNIYRPAGQGPHVRDPAVFTHCTIGAVEQPPLLIAHSLMSTHENPFPL